MKLTTESSIQAIAARYNELMGTDTAEKSLAKRGKAKLLAKIKELEEAAAKAKAEADAEAAAKAAAAKPAKKSSKIVGKKVQGPTIRQEAEALLLEVVYKDEDERPYGHPYEQVLTLLLAKFAGAKTTIACLRWYAVHMRDRGEKVPNRPRAGSTPKE